MSGAWTNVWLENAIGQMSGAKNRLDKCLARKFDWTNVRNRLFLNNIDKGIHYNMNSDTGVTILNK